MGQRASVYLHGSNILPPPPPRWIYQRNSPLIRTSRPTSEYLDHDRSDLAFQTQGLSRIGSPGPFSILGKRIQRSRDRLLTYLPPTRLSFFGSELPSLSAGTIADGPLCKMNNSRIPDGPHPPSFSLSPTILSARCSCRDFSFLPSFSSHSLLVSQIWSRSLRNLNFRDRCSSIDRCLRCWSMYPRIHQPNQLRPTPFLLRHNPN